MKTAIYGLVTTDVEAAKIKELNSPENISKPVSSGIVETENVVSKSCRQDTNILPLTDFFI